MSLIRAALSASPTRAALSAIAPALSAVGGVAGAVLPTRFYAELLARAGRLPEGDARNVLVERDIPLVVDGGVVLLADRHFPRGAGPMPTVLVRTPYGRRGACGLLYGTLLARSGLQVVIQSTRGTFGSGGEFRPFDERADGLATIEWIRRQPWHAGKVGMAGASYMGLTQWAVADSDGLGALAPAVTATQFHGVTFGGGLQLESMAAWHMLTAVQEEPLALVQGARVLSRLQRAFSHLPLEDIDMQVLGRQHPAYRRVLANPLWHDQFWSARDHTRRAAHVTAPVLFIAGWHDIFTPSQLEDYVALRRAGRRPRLIVGPWTHTSEGMWITATRETVRWLRAHLLGDPAVPAPEVRIQVGGSGQWRHLRDWPPPDASDWRLRLQPGRRLAAETAPPSEPDCYRYDPDDPTPSIGGPVLLSRRAVVNNAPLERRADVLTYTSAPLDEPVEAIGPVRVCLCVRSSLEFFDVFARVCDVDRSGVSRNVCDALERVAPERYSPDSRRIHRVEFALWPTAHRFGRGHRVRLQVSSGAHPRYARNTGTGEPLGSATRLLVADQEIFHDPEHRSEIVLSIVAS